MHRLGSRVLSVAAVTALAAACTAGSKATADRRQRLAGLRQQAGLADCPPALSTDFPALSLACIGSGRTLPVRGAPGRPLLVNFYNTNCAPCQDEFPTLAAYQAGQPEVGLVGVDAQDDPVSELAFVRDFKATWPAVSDPHGRLFRKYAGGWPVTIAVRANGTLSGVHVGRLKTLADVQALAGTAQG